MISKIFVLHIGCLLDVALGGILEAGIAQAIDVLPVQGSERIRVKSISVAGSGEFSELQRGPCQDAPPEHTGFDVHGGEGFMKHAACEDLLHYCHNSSIGEQVRVSCPLSCMVCKPGHAESGHNGESGPCFDAVNTGIRFKDGPKAACPDLVNYCNHSSIGAQVSEACKLTCGRCGLVVEAPFLDAHGNCIDLQTHEEPQFTVAGALAGCSDIAQFCENHPDSNLIRHKCPLTCGVCGNDDEATTTTPESSEIKIPGDAGGCDRRRRWGFCSTRRRRNV